MRDVKSQTLPAEGVFSEALNFEYFHYIHQKVQSNGQSTFGLV